MKTNEKYDPPAIEARAFNPATKSFFEGISWEIIDGAVSARADGDLLGLDLFTNVLDSKAQKIFTNDIVRLGDTKEYTSSDGTKKNFAPLAPADTNLLVTFEDGQIKTKEGTLHEISQWHRLELVGNAHQNPDLVK